MLADRLFTSLIKPKQPMMWLRRVFALLLAIIFIIIFIPMLVIFRINGTVGNPDFYIDQLRQADIYNFIYDKVLPSALEEAKINNDIPDVFISRIKPHIVPMVEQTVPRAWLQAQVEQVITEVLPYALGDTQDFRIDVPLKDRAEACAQAVKNTLGNEELFLELYDQALNLFFDENESNLKETPFNKDQLKRAVNRVLPAQWVLTQVNGVIDEVTPFFTGDRAHYKIHLDLSSRLGDLENVAVDILKSKETYNYLFEKVLAPTLKQNIQDVTRLPVEVVLTDDEIIEAMKKIMPLEWYQVQVTDVTQQVFSYLKGTGQTPELVIPLADRKPVAIAVLIEMVNKKAGMDVSAAVSPSLNDLVNDWIPDQWTLEELLSNSNGSADVEDMLRQVREYIDNGWNYTDDDLRVNMGADYKTVEDIRQKISGGIVFTEKDIRNLVGKGNSTQLQDFDNMRLLLGKARRWMMAAWLIPAFILLAIGALGARKWTNKLVWGASVLAATSLLIFILCGPVFSAVVKPELNRALAQAVNQNQGLETLIAEKGVSMTQNAINSFIGGLTLQALILLAVSLALIAFGIFWYKIKSKLKVKNTSSE